MVDKEAEARVKVHKLPHLTRDVTGQHYHPVLSDVSLPRLSERRRRLKFRLELSALRHKSMQIMSTHRGFFDGPDCRE